MPGVYANALHGDQFSINTLLKSDLPPGVNQFAGVAGCFSALAQLAKEKLVGES